MPVGLNTTNVANALLNNLRGGTFSNASTWVQLHTGDPGAAGTNAVSAVTTRQSATFAAASGGAIALSASPTAWNMTTTETISYISVWSASTAGNFLWSAQLSVSKSVANGDTLTLTTCGLSLAPLAA
jgi:hypothetical protein